MIIAEVVKSQPHLSEIPGAGNLLRIQLAATYGRQQHGHENGDDRHDHQQFNQGKSANRFVGWAWIHW